MPDTDTAQTQATRSPSTTRHRSDHDDGLKLTCCGCIDIRRGVILTLWVQLTFVLLMAALLLVVAIVFPSLGTGSDVPGDDIADLLREIWLYFAIYLALTLFTSAGLVTVKLRKLQGYKAFTLVNTALFFAEVVLAAVVQAFQVYSIVALVLRAYWAWVFYRYIATLAMEIEHIERHKEMDGELYC